MTKDLERAISTLTVFDPDDRRRAEVDLPGETLEDQLSAAQAWLDAHGDEHPGCSTRLFCSWTPAEGQAAMTLPAGLVRALARVDGTFWLDAYPQD